MKLKCIQDQPIEQLEVLGSLDELNAVLGIIRATGKFPQIKPIQETILKLHYLEDIPTLEVPQTQQKDFIIPGDNQVESFLHLARTIAKRTERNMIKASWPEQKQAYVNSLANYLFSLAIILK